MKRTLQAALIAAPLFVTGVAHAAGYTGPGSAPGVTQVSAALEATDDTPVTLEGTIVRRLGDEAYEFKDASGATIQVEIDDDDWPTRAVDENQKVRLIGEVDVGRSSREIDVDRVELID
ncbi:YgiW/YdeI family stress tolerance OB fold protein [Pseudomonas aeruginosa]|uniref:YgiW/YdeI family stress tolerance OB fold protein n=1 Tax=Pseudomonas aeruginosa TaxID=287 RepID=UPI0026F342AD|nr:NirD/YgiW/YdeI family stress tolerance protein [Pseudomonas aeruginosa]